MPSFLYDLGTLSLLSSWYHILLKLDAWIRIHVQIFRHDPYPLEPKHISVPFPRACSYKLLAGGGGGRLLRHEAAHWQSYWFKFWGPFEFLTKTRRFHQVQLLLQLCINFADPHSNPDPKGEEIVTGTKIKISTLKKSLIRIVRAKKLIKKFPFNLYRYVVLVFRYFNTTGYCRKKNI